MMSDESKGDEILHDDLVETPSKVAPSPNPFASASNITVSVPETVEVKLVDASVLTDYEVWSLVASITSTAVVGFFVAYLQERSVEVSNVFLVTALVFVLISAIAGGMAMYKRNALRNRTRRIQFSVGEQITDTE